MSATAERLFQEALLLPLPEILDLMDRLEEHVEPLLTPPQEQEFELSPEWDAEIKRRIEDIESGNAKLISSDEFFASLRAEEGDDESGMIAQGEKPTQPTDITSNTEADRSLRVSPTISNRSHAKSPRIRMPQPSTCVERESEHLTISRT